jgi:hypothetical protein
LEAFLFYTSGILMLAIGRGFRHKRTFPSIQTLLNGAGGISADLLDSTKELFPAANIFSAYGESQ